METTTKSFQLDGLDQTADGKKTFGEISDEIRANLAPHRVVTEIRIDGRPIDIAEEEQLTSKALGEIGSLELRSRNVGELFMESLALAPKICEAIHLDCDDIQTFLANSQSAEANERISEMAALVEWLLQLVLGLESFGSRKLKDLEFSEGRVVDSVARMQSHLARLYAYMAQSKWEEFKTVLAGDFRSEVAIWRKLFSELISSWTPRSSVLES